VRGLAQISFLTYKGSAVTPYFEKVVPHVESIGQTIVQLFHTISPDFIVVRRDLIVSSRSFLQGPLEFKRGLTRQLNKFLDEKILLGTETGAKQSSVDTTRVYAFSFLNELVSAANKPAPNTPSELTINQISKILYLFGKNIHDTTLDLKQQISAVKLIQSMADPIFKAIEAAYTDQRWAEQTAQNKQPPPYQPARSLLIRIIYICTTKFESLRQLIPQKLEELAEKSKTQTKSPEESDDIHDFKILLGTLVICLKQTTWALYHHKIIVHQTIPATQNAPAQQLPQVRRANTALDEEETNLLARLFEAALKCFQLYSYAIPTNYQVIAVPPEYEEKYVIDQFAGIFINLEQRNFRDLLAQCIEPLFNSIVDNPRISLLHIPQVFLQGSQSTGATSQLNRESSNNSLGISKAFADITLSFLIRNMANIADHSAAPNATESSNHVTMNPDHANVISAFNHLFRLVFGSVADNEVVLRPYINPVVTLSLKYACEVGNPMVYFQLLRSLFRSIGGGKWEILYKEFLPMLPDLLTTLMKINQRERNAAMKETCLELCLTVPARLSSLLPFIPLLIRAVLYSIQAKEDSVIKLGLRTLEFWVDNLNPEYLYPHLHPILSPLMRSLCALMKPNSVSNFGANALSILGKLGGRNRRFLNEPMNLPIIEPIEEGLSVQLQWNSDKSLEQFNFDLPLDRAIQLAGHIMKNLPAVQSNASPPPALTAQQLESSVAAYNVIRAGVLSLMNTSGSAAAVFDNNTTLPRSKLLRVTSSPTVAAQENELVQNYRTRKELQRQQKHDQYIEEVLRDKTLSPLAFQPAQPTDIKKQIHSTEMLRQLAATEKLLKSAIQSLFLAASTSDEKFKQNSESVAFMNGLVLHFAGLSCLAESDSISAANINTTIDHLDEINPSVLLEAIIASLEEEEGVRFDTVLAALKNYVQTMIQLVGLDTTIDNPYIKILTENLIHCCYSEKIESKYAGATGINVLSELLVPETVIRPVWFIRYEIDLIRALQSTLSDEKSYYTQLTQQKANQTLDKIVSTIVKKVSTVETEEEKKETSVKMEAETNETQLEEKVLITAEEEKEEKMTDDANITVKAETKPVEQANKEKSISLHNLIASISSFLNHSIAEIRSNTARLLNYISELTGRHLSDLLFGHRSSLLQHIRSRQLQVLSIPARIGAISAASYLLNISQAVLNGRECLYLIKQLSEEFAGDDLQSNISDKGPITSRIIKTQLTNKLRAESLILLTQCLNHEEIKKDKNFKEYKDSTVKIFFKALLLKNEEIGLAARSGLSATVAATRGEKLPKELLQVCLRPILLNLADYRRLSIPLLEGLGRLLELLANCFNVTLGEKLLDHLRGFAENELLLQLRKEASQDKSGMAKCKPEEEVKICQLIIGLFHLLPAAEGKFLESLINVTMKLEDNLATGYYCMPGEAGAGTASPFRPNLLKFLQFSSNQAKKTCELFLRNASKKRYQQMFLSLLRMPQAELLRKALASEPHLLARWCFHWDRAAAEEYIKQQELVEREKLAAEAKAKEAEKAAQQQAQAAAASTNPEEKAVQSAADQPASTESKDTAIAMDTSSTTAITSTTTASSLPLLSVPTAASITQSSNIAKSAETQDPELMERILVGLNILAILSTFDPSILKINASTTDYQLFNFASEVFVSKGRHFRYFREEQLGITFLDESRLLITIFLNHAKVNRDEYDNIWNLLSVFKIKSLTDYSFLTEFFTKELPNTYTAQQQQRLLKLLLHDLKEPNQSQAAKSRALQRIIRPLIKFHLIKRKERLDKVEKAAESAQQETAKIASPTAESSKKKKIDRKAKSKESEMQVENVIPSRIAVFVEEDVVDTEMLESMIRIFADQNDSISSGNVHEDYVSELLRLCNLLLKYLGSDLEHFNKKIMEFIWKLCKSDASNLKHWGQLAVARYISIFPTPPEIVAQVYIALLRSNSGSSTVIVDSVHRSLAKLALDILAPHLSSRLPPSHPNHSFLKLTRRILSEEQNQTSTQIHIWSLIIKHAKLFYAERNTFLSIIIQGVNRVANTPNRAAEYRKLCLDLAEVTINWDKQWAAANDITLKDEEMKTEVPAAAHIAVAGDEPINKPQPENITNLMYFFIRFSLQAANENSSETRQLSRRSIKLIREALEVWQNFNPEFEFRVIEKTIASFGQPNENQYSTYIAVLDLINTLGKQHSKNFLLNNITAIDRYFSIIVQKFQNTVLRDPMVELLNNICSIANPGETHAKEELNKFFGHVKELCLVPFKDSSKGFPYISLALMLVWNKYDNKIVVDNLVALFKSLQRLVKDCVLKQTQLIQWRQNNPRNDVGYSDEKMKLIMINDCLRKNLQLMCDNMEHIGEYKKSFNTTLVYIIEKSMDNSILLDIAKLLEKWFQNPDTPAAQLYSLKEKANFLLKLTRVERDRGHSETLLTILNCVLHIWKLSRMSGSNPQQQQFASDLLLRVQRAFMLGLRYEEDPGVREKFVNIFHSFISRSVFDRLNYIFAIQDWEYLSDSFWIIQALDLLLTIIPTDKYLIANKSIPITPSISVENEGKIRASRTNESLFESKKFNSNLDNLEELTQELAEFNTNDAEAIRIKFGRRAGKLGIKSSTLPANTVAISPAAPSSTSASPTKKRKADEVSDTASSTAVEVKLEETTFPNSRPEIFKAWDSWLNNYGSLSVGDLISALRVLSFHSIELSHSLFTTLVPIAWAKLNPSERSELFAAIQILLSRDWHKRYNEYEMSHTAHRIHPVQTLLFSLKQCQPQPPINAEIIRFLGKNYNCWHIAADMLEHKVNAQSAENNQLTAGNLLLGAVHNQNSILFPPDCLGALYRELNEEDLLYGLWKRRSQNEFVQAALSYQQFGQWQRAQDIIFLTLHKHHAEQAKNKESNANQPSEVLGANELSRSELLLLESEWVRCCTKLNQWEVLNNFASAERGGIGLVETQWDASWRIGDWNNLRDLTYKYAQSSHELPNAKLYALYHLLHERKGNQEEYSRLLDQVIQFTLKEFQSLPSFVNHSHINLLHRSHRLVELTESNQMQIDLIQAITRHITPNFKNIIGTWRERLCNKWEDLSTWSDILTWRMQMFNILFSQYNLTLQQQNQGSSSASSSDSAKLVSDFSWTQIKLASIARKQQLVATAFSTLNRLYIAPGQLDSSDNYFKLREQIKCCLLNANEISTALNIISSTNLEPLDYSQRAEMFRMKGESLQHLGYGDESNTAFSASLSINDQFGRGWLSWGLFCDRVFSLKRDIAWADHALVCFIQAISYKYKKSYHQMSKIFNLLSQDNNVNGVVIRAFQRFQEHIPAWHFILYLPQLLSGLSRYEGQACRIILNRIARQYPQAAWYTIRASIIEKKEILQQQAVAKQHQQQQQQQQPATTTSAATNQPAASNAPAPQAMEVDQKEQPPATAPAASTGPAQTSSTAASTTSTAAPPAAPTPSQLAAQPPATQPLNPIQPGSAEATNAPANIAAPAAAPAAVTANANQAATGAAPTAAAAPSTAQPAAPHSAQDSAQSAVYNNNPSMGLLEDVVNTLRRNHPVLVQEMERLMEDFRARHKSDLEEELLSNLQKLLQQALKAPLISEEIIPSTMSQTLDRLARKYFSLPSDPYQQSRKTLFFIHKYKLAFDADFLLSHPEKKFPQTMTELILRLKKWISHLHYCLTVRHVNGGIPIEQYNSNLALQTSFDVEIPGQYSHDREPVPDQHIVLSKISSTIATPYSINNSFQRVINMLGDDGKSYPFLLQTANPHSTRCDERISQFYIIINRMIHSFKETRRRDLVYYVPVIIPWNPRFRLLRTEANQTSLESIYEYCQTANNKDIDAPLISWKNKYRQYLVHNNTSRTENNSLEMENSMKLRIYNEICAETVPDYLLTRYVSSHFDLSLHADQYFAFKSELCRSMSLSGYLSYLMKIGDRGLNKIHINLQSGRVYNSDYYPQYNEHQVVDTHNEGVPFRLTRNFQSFFNSQFIDGLFAAVLQSMNMCFIQNVDVLKQYLLLFFRDDLTSYMMSHTALSRSFEYTDSNARNFERQLKDKFNNNIGNFVKRIQALTTNTPQQDSNKSQSQQIQPQNHKIHHMIRVATAKTKLAVMNPQWHPWF
jgi:phosphatidylinositol kinase/protein kinase (PI-3  family)